MKISVKRLYELQQSGEWDPAWLVRYGIFEVASLEPPEDPEDSWLLYPPFPYNLDPIDNQEMVSDETELSWYDPSLLDEIKGIVDHFFEYTGSMALNDHAARKHLEVIQRAFQKHRYI